MKPKILIIGSTGKLGTKLLKYAYSNNIRIFAATCFSNENKLISQKSKYNINKTFILSNQNERDNFLKFLTSKISLIYFLDFGSFSLIYLNQFLKYNSKSTIAIANKEMIIAGGQVLINSIKNSKNYLLPLDSEHFSLTKSLSNTNQYINKIFITASGGPFYFKKRINIKKVNLTSVLNHPKWKMGINNSIDSSNFINKILEIFELSSIFQIDLTKINFLVSKSAFVHSVVLYDDCVISINAFTNNMLIPMISPLKKFFNCNNIPNNFNKVLDTKNLKLEVYSDKRFKIIRHLNFLKTLGHSGQINFMLINNLAQKLYLNNELKYFEIPDFIINKLKKEKNSIEFNNIKEVLIYINSFKAKQYEKHR